MVGHAPLHSNVRREEGGSDADSSFHWLGGTVLQEETDFSKVSKQN